MFFKSHSNHQDFKITEHRNYGNQAEIYCDVTNRITGVTFEDISISRSNLKDSLKAYDWGER